jgi:hypothetical protein
VTRGAPIAQIGRHLTAETPSRKGRRFGVRPEPRGAAPSGSPPDLGYLSFQVAAKLVSDEITGKEGETFTVPSLNGGQPYTIGKDSVVILGPAFRFDASNVDNFNF